MAHAIRLGDLDVKDQADYLIDNLVEAKEKDKKVLKKKPEIKQAILYTVLELLKKDEVDPIPNLGKWQALDLELTPKLLTLKFGYYVDLCGVEFKPDSFAGYDIAAACFYQTDFNADYDIFALQKRAEDFSKVSVIYSIWGMKMFEAMVTLLKDTFPILYEGASEDNDDVRKANNMLMVLCKEDATRWDEAKNMTVFNAFSFLERRAIQLDNAKRKTGN